MFAEIDFPAMKHCIGTQQKLLSVAFFLQDVAERNNARQKSVFLAIGISSQIDLDDHAGSLGGHRRCCPGRSRQRKSSANSISIGKIKVLISQLFEFRYTGTGDLEARLFISIAAFH